MQKNYNYCLDFVKGIACIFVVWMHCEFPGVMGTVVQAVSRFSVPFFFMVSGYFCFQVTEKEKMRQKIRHIAKMTLFSTLFYLVFALFCSVYFHDLKWTLKWTSIVAWIGFNQPLPNLGHHLWFLFALLYTYVSYYFLSRHFHYRLLYVLALLMFAVYYILAQGLHIVGVHIPNFVYRNWLVEGYAFFMLGHLLHAYKNKIRINNQALVLIIIVSSLLCFLERLLMGRDFGVNVCTLPQVAALFLYAIKNPTRHEGLIQRIGRNCSMLVYILHIFVYESFLRFYAALGIDDNMLALYLLPILVVMCAILLSMLCNKVVSGLKKDGC